MSDSATPDYAGDAYRACLHGDATPNQQRSAAAQIILLHGIKGELVAAARLAVAVIDEETEIVIKCNTGPGGVISDPEARKTLDKYDEAVNALNAAIAKADPIRELLAERDKLRQDVLTLALRLHFEDPDMHAPETREVLARWRPAVNAEIARRTA